MNRVPLKGSVKGSERVVQGLNVGALIVRVLIGFWGAVLWLDPTQA